MWTHPTVRYKGRSVYCTYSGIGVPVVFLHGFLEDHTMWLGFEKRLAEMPVQAIFIDLPGQGQSDVMAPIHSMEFMAEVVKHTLESIGVPAAYVVGHSMGGYVGLALAELYPEMVKGICLYHSHAAADGPEKKKDRERAVKVINKNLQVFVNEAIPNLFAPGNVNRFGFEIDGIKRIAMNTPLKGIEACLLGMRDRPDRTAFFKNLSIPKLIVAGDQDPVIPLEMLESHLHKKADPVLAVLANTGHMSFLENTEASIEVVTLWFERCFNSPKAETAP